MKTRPPTASQAALLEEAIRRYDDAGPLHGGVTLLGLAAWGVPDPYRSLSEARKGAQRLRDLGYLEATGADFRGLALYAPTEKGREALRASRA